MLWRENTGINVIIRATPLIFERNEWVEVSPDTDAEDCLALWVLRRREDPKEYQCFQIFFLPFIDFFRKKG